MTDLPDPEFDEADLYEGDPDPVLPRTVGEVQDDGLDEEEPDEPSALAGVQGFAARATGQRDTPGTLAWYRTHETTSQIGFNPDGMCLKVVRTARNIGPMFASALALQQATPPEFRVHRIRDIRAGMIGLSDDPADGNPYGHVYTFMGRVKGADRDDPHGLVTRTNSVVPGRLVPVRLTFYQSAWGDEFQFASRWLNGVVLDLPSARPDKQPKHPLFGVWGRKRLERIIDMYDRLIEANAGDERKVKALRRDRREIKETLNRKVRG